MSGLLASFFDGDLASDHCAARCCVAEQFSCEAMKCLLSSGLAFLRYAFLPPTTHARVAGQFSAKL